MMRRATVAVLLCCALAVPALARDGHGDRDRGHSSKNHHGDRHHGYNRHWNKPHWRRPPVVYAQPPVVYAPPAVVGGFLGGLLLRGLWN